MVAFGCLFAMSIAFVMMRPLENQRTCRTLLLFHSPDFVSARLRCWRLACPCRGCELVVKELPPHWDPPPRIGYGETRPALTLTTLAIHASSPANWFWKLYLDKIERVGTRFWNSETMKTLDEKQLSGFIDLFQERKVYADQARWINAEIEIQLQQESISEEREQLLKKFQELCKAQDNDAPNP